MTDRVYPSSKPATNGTLPAAPAAAAAAAATTNNVSKPPNLYNPSRIPYRQPHHRSYRRSRRNYCCCCLFWTILLLLALALMASIAGAALYVLYRPHRPTFDIITFRVNKLNLTTAPDSASSHIAALLNLTISSHNPNNHINFFYEPFTVYALTASEDVALGNGTLPAFTSYKQNTTTLRTTVSASQDLDIESVKSVRADLKKKTGVPLKIRMDTNVKVKVGGFKSRKVGIKVTCDGIKAAQPKGKSPTVASVKNSDCKVDLRIKIWRWTY